MSATTAVQSKIADAFSKLSYEPVLDSDASVKSWIGIHNSGLFTPFINGSYLNNDDKRLTSSFSTKNPFNGNELARLSECNSNVFESAVKSAREALESWTKLGYIGRGKIIYNIARNFQKNLSIVTLVEALNSGRTSREVKDLDVASIIKSLYYYGGSCSFESELSSYDALGVVAITGYWDSSLLTLVNKVSAALAVGNTCIIVPHRLTPLGVFMFVDICVQSGLPAGVLNVIMSENDKIYEQISSSPLIDCVSYDGTTALAQEYIYKKSYHLPNKQLLFSLNGKSSTIIYDSADIDSAVESVVDGCFFSNGQHRYSVNKVLVQENVYDHVLSALDKRFRKLRAGNNLDKCNDFGPLISENDAKVLQEAFDKQISNEFKESLVSSTNVQKYFDSVQDKVAKNVVQPTIVTNIQVNTEFYQNELNGPYVIVVPFRTVKESIDIINNSKFGSGVSLWSENISLVMEAAYNLQVGSVWINSVSIEKGVETRKYSGNYHVRGKQSLLNFLKPKWQNNFENEAEINVEKFEKDLKQFGSVSPNAAIPTAELLKDEKTYKLYIGGKQTRPDSQSSKAIYDIENTKTLLCLIADAGRKDVRNAVEAASSAFNDWKKRINHNKAQILYFFAENLSTRKNEFVNKLETITHKSHKLCEQEFDLAINQIFLFASKCDKYTGRLNDTTDYGALLEVDEPLGIIAIICGHSKHPLLSFITHLTAALAYGNSVIIVPDEKLPMPALDLYEVFETSDMPGVVNILSGNKHHLTKHLCEHQQVNAIWYMTDDNLDLSAIRFIKYTSNFSLKNYWIINNVFKSENIDENFLNNDYSQELALHSVQYKYIHIPMGTIFAN